jgi:hypothetical protein
MDSAISNSALKIHLAWGPERAKPFATRVTAAHPGLSPHDIQALERDFSQIESAAWGSVVAAMKAHGMNDAAARTSWKKPLLAKWPWLSEANLSSLWTQGCYYAWHDGELT